jgi:hypothetical protein
VDQPEQHPQQRRLARAVGTEQAPNLPRRDRYLDAVNSGPRPEALDQSARSNGIHDEWNLPAPTPQLVKRS